MVFNRYVTRGGEEEAFHSELELLRANGWPVVPVVGPPTSPATPLGYVRLGLEAVWSRRWHRRLRDVVRRVRPVVVHVHNTFPSMSPAVCHAAREGGAAVVHTLHNYRLVCPNAMCFRDGHPCTDCVGRALPWPGVVHACYRGSRLETAGAAAVLGVHRALRTWEQAVDLFVALTEFQRRVLLRGGLPPDRVTVKPNFLHPDPLPRPSGPGSYFLFAGRLAGAKGVRTLVRAWAGLEAVPLKVVGDAPSTWEERRLADLRRPPGVEFLGRRTRQEVLGLLKGARALVFPSEWFEGFPLAIVEAFACGIPVIASHLGSISEIVTSGRTGLLFPPGDAADLARKIRWAWSHPTEMAEMGREARREFEARYTAARNLELLTRIYVAAAGRRKP